MTDRNGSQFVEHIEGRSIIFSSSTGTTNIDEIKWLTDTVISYASAWHTHGWAYIADCSKMNPVTPSEGSELAIMTRKFVESGCKAIAFVDGDSIMLKVQAQKNTQRSETGVLEGHFYNREDALSWLKETTNL